MLKGDRIFFCLKGFLKIISEIPRGIYEILKISYLQCAPTKMMLTLSRIPLGCSGGKFFIFKLKPFDRFGLSFICIPVKQYNQF